jgi:hypothetical protein
VREGGRGGEKGAGVMRPNGPRTTNDRKSK